ncbi:MULTISPECIES: NAD-dependent epimerase/dehydratase family protein [Brucella]|jgi:dTDP-6-deoxy-L-talose 4-dehydrogenase (NAD+)|uniref:NAD-dependent epimerase/dehydratase family protein n=1 Tax=Brucella TaxID=234 RepID=UPI000CFE324C|nr:MULTISPECIES: NAD(P)-dependent oxidoreductase [Brucella]MQP41495.1 NAD-dependent epimerase/dehydratase family protein [Ochrobactrum sp. MYb237]PQZ40056.1 nucleoside-diphosphate sugar epimerase [Brucella pseudogrignonensis]PRA39785.1 nucleoside-diphosphate sugar epimerase [Brucella pseudogrignonensis]PRA66218.1 nucleoside-diphosphate sugar epimerase [Brucella pseudogrignonensis]
MKVLVSGANGYIGRYVVSSLVDRGHDVVVAVRGQKDPAFQCEVFNGDILASTPDIYERTGRPDVLVHMAWEDGFLHRSESHLANVQNHVRFVENMLKGGLPQIVTAGTAHEIGYHVGAVDELTPTRPMHPYGIAKNYLRQAQAYLCEVHGAINQWTRCYYIWGDDVRNSSIFTKLLEAEASGQETFPLNHGELLYDFINVKDLGEMIARVALQTEVTGIINCSSGEPVSLKTMVLQFIEANNLKIVPVWGEFPIRSYDSRAIWGDNQKIKQVMDNKP